MEHRDAKPHPGPYRVALADSESAGLLIAVGFLVMALVSMPLAAAFVVGAILLGVVVAFLLHLPAGRSRRVLMGAVLILVVFVLWWAGRKAPRPPTVASDALYVLPNNVPFTLFRTGFWLDCRFDKSEHVDKCRLTDESGKAIFEDVFLPCVGQTPLPQGELVLKPVTGETWTRSQDGKINVPVVHLENGQKLLSRTVFTQAKEQRLDR